MSRRMKKTDITVEDLMNALIENGIRLKVNSLNEPTVVIPEDGHQQEWPVDSQRFKDYLMSLSYELSNKQALSPGKLNIILCLIREDCRKGARELSELDEKKVESNPILQTTLVLMNSKSVVQKPTAKLLEDLREIERRNGFSTGEYLTTFTNIFSRQLNRLTPVLNGYGVQVAIDHKEDGSHTTLKRIEGVFKKEPVDSNVRTEESSDASDGLHVRPSSGINPKTDLSSTPTDDAEDKKKSAQKGGEK